jgi:hypothetical protein
VSGEIEQAKDYYILFCDTEAPVPTPDVYKKRCRQQDVLIADKASYVWGYAGKLTCKQAEAAELRLKLEFWERFRKVWESAGEKCETNFGFYFDFEIADRKPGALDCLAQLSPDLDFLSYVSPHHGFMFYPDRREVLQIEDALKSLTEQGNPGFYCASCVLEYVKTHWSYVKLLSFEDLTAGWEYIEYCSSMDLLRHTAASLVIWETLYDEFRIKQKMGISVCPEVMKNTFETTVRDDRKYIPSLEFHQLAVLAECVDIVNNIRNAYDCEDFENVYASRAIDLALEEMVVGSYELEKALERIELTELDVTSDELRTRMVKLFARTQELQSKLEKKEAELKAKAERKANREDTIAILAPVFKELQEIKVAVNKAPEAGTVHKDGVVPGSADLPPKTKKKRVKSANPKPQVLTKGTIHDALVAFFHKKPDAAKEYSAERLADILRSRKKNPIKRCTASGVKATLAWQQYCKPFRHREKTISLDARGNTRDSRAKTPSEILDEQSADAQDESSDTDQN